MRGIIQNIATKAGTCKVINILQVYVEAFLHRAQLLMHILLRFEMSIGLPSCLILSSINFLELVWWFID